MGATTESDSGARDSHTTRVYGGSRNVEVRAMLNTKGRDNGTDKGKGKGASLVVREPPQKAAPNSTISTQINCMGINDM